MEGEEGSVLGVEVVVVVNGDDEMFSMTHVPPASHSISRQDLNSLLIFPSSMSLSFLFFEVISVDVDDGDGDGFPDSS